MASKERYAVEMYKKNRDGIVALARSIPCKSLEEARSRAEKSFTTNGSLGAAALVLSGDDFLGLSDSPQYFAIFGEVPSGVTDDILF